MHRTAFHERGRATGALIPWMSANATLADNLSFYEEIEKIDGGEALFTFAWENHKCILQKPGEPTCKARDFRWRFRPKRIKDKKLFTLRDSPPAHPKTDALAKCSEHRELGAACKHLGVIIRPS